MDEHRPVHVLLAVAVVALAALGGSVLLDHHESWGHPRQAVANVLWIVFLLSCLALVALSVRVVARGRSGRPFVR